MDTEQTLVEAAILVWNDDYSASLDAVAARAGVTRRTLNRYFGDRQLLYAACQQEMWRSCQQATSRALAQSQDPMQQLEALLYASIDCGTKYAFLQKINLVQESGQSPAAETPPFEPLHQVLLALQQRSLLSPELSLPWALLLFNGVIQATIQAETAGTVARRAIKGQAWLSFRQAIGLPPLPATPSAA